MKRQNFEVIFNNGEFKQILMLPETPLKIFFLFGEKELVLREKKDKHGLYVISHQRGFPKPDSGYDYNQEFEISSQSNAFNDNQKDLNLENTEGVIFERFGEPPNKQPINDPTLQRLTKFVESLKDLQAEIKESQSHYNTSDSPIIKEYASVQENSTTIRSANSETSPLIYAELIYSQPQWIIPNLSPKQSEIGTVQPSIQINTPVTHQIELITQQDELTTRDNTAQSESNPIETNNNHDCNQNESSSDIGNIKICNVQSAVMNDDSNEDDTAMDFDLRCSDVSDYDGDDINTFSEEHQNTSILKNNLKICDNQNKPERETINTTPFVNNRKYLFRKCVMCLRYETTDRLLTKFPSNCKMSNIWAKISGRKWVLKCTPRERNRRFFVCSDHFKPEDFSAGFVPGTYRLKQNIIPSQNLPNQKETAEQKNAEIFGRLRTKLQVALHTQHEPVPRRDIQCCVPLCTSSKSKFPDYSFHPFPPENCLLDLKVQGLTVRFRVRQEWIKFLGIKEPVTSYMRVCSRHFQKSDFYEGDKKHTVRLKRCAIPSQYLPPLTLSEDLNIEVEKNENHVTSVKEG